MRGACGLAVVSLLSALSLAQEFQNPKLIDILPYKGSHAPIIAPNNGYPILISTDQNMMTITVAISGVSYSANFRQSRDFKSSVLVVGDLVPARLEGDKLILKKPNGKEAKASVTRRAQLGLDP
jgi:hypothetical protein